MISIGNFNNLRIERFVDHGAYLVEPDDESHSHKTNPIFKEVLLPARYVTDKMVVGDIIKVFVYTDSEDRPVATTEIPFATVGEFAFLQVSQVNRVGAFMDWGLSKNLLVPFKEQRVKMCPGGIYPIYIYLDTTTNRVVASAKLEKFLGNVYPDYTRGQKVTALVMARTPIGYKTIVDNRHAGMIYENEVFSPLDLGSTVPAYVKQVRNEDGKIDLTLTAPGTLGRIEKIADKILRQLAEGDFSLNDHSSPDEIRSILGCSKKDFKKAVGALYREAKITILENGNIEITEKK